MGTLPQNPLLPVSCKQIPSRYGVWAISNWIIIIKTYIAICLITTIKQNSSMSKTTTIMQNSSMSKTSTAINQMHNSQFAFKRTSSWGKKWRESERRRRRCPWCEGCWSASRSPPGTWISSRDRCNRWRGSASQSPQTRGSSWWLCWNSISGGENSSAEVHDKSAENRGAGERVWGWSRAIECP